MSTFRIDLTRRAAKSLDAIDKPQRRRVLVVIDGLATDPRPPGCAKLTGRENQWRVRAGNYRVIYEVHDDRLLVLVVDVGHRSEIHRSP